MTKIQLATKAAWNGLMLLFFGNILAVCRSISLNPERVRCGRMDLATMRWIYIFVFFCVCLSLVLAFRFLRNFSLPLRLAGTTAIYAERNCRAFFIKINRIVCIFVGIILLCGYWDALVLAGSLIIHFFPAGREWFTLWAEGNVSSALEKGFIAIARIFYPFGFLAFCGYLVLGADRFICWQIRLLDKFITKEPCNE